MTITKITSEPYNVFEAFQFMNVMILEQDGTEREISIVEPLISEVLKAKPPFITITNNKRRTKVVLWKL